MSLYPILIAAGLAFFAAAFPTKPGTAKLALYILAVIAFLVAAVVSATGV